MDIKPASEIAAELLSQPPQNVVIMNGHSGIVIPSTTIQEINSLDLPRQLRIRTLLNIALQHANTVTLTPKE